MLDAAKYFVTNSTQTFSAVTFADGLREFLEEENRLSAAQCDSYRQHAENFSAYVGEAKLISEIKTEDVQQWLRAKGAPTAPLGKKTWNNLALEQAEQQALSLRPFLLSTGIPRRPASKRFTKGAAGPNSRLGGLRARRE